ncbi:hypothetical protein [Melittangium boletus]|uniref:hypothetical protein n=1 Tax=Melittangium boletus TaxID=83453 RepID=UPI003DA436A3
MGLSAEALRLLRKGLVICAEVPASSAEYVAWVGVHPFVDMRRVGKCGASGVGKTRFVIRGCEAPRASVDAGHEFTGALKNEREEIVHSEAQVEAVLAAWGIDAATLERDRAPYPY